MKSFSLPIALSAILLAQTAPAMADTFLYGSYCVGPGCPLIPSTLNSPTVFGGYSTTELTSAGATTVGSGATQPSSHPQAQSGRRPVPLPLPTPTGSHGNLEPVQAISPIHLQPVSTTTTRHSH